jgi:hypothetical protein
MFVVDHRLKARHGVFHIVMTCQLYNRLEVQRTAYSGRYQTYG